MQTAKPKSKRRTIILAAIAIAVIVGGGAGAYFLLLHNSSGTTGADFTLTIYQGNPNSPSNTWAPVTNGTILLNGTSIPLVVKASVPPGSSFNDIIQLSFNSPVTGVTGLMPRPTVHPSGASFSTTGLNLTAASTVPVQKLAYNFTVTGTGGATQVSHTVTFPLLIRDSVLSVSLASAQTSKHNSFNVSVGISDVYSIYGFQFDLNYNASLVTADNYSFAPVFYPLGTKLIHSHGNWYNTTGPGIDCATLPSPCYGFAGEVILNNTIGRVSLAATLLGGCGISVICPDATGNAVYDLANVTFTASSAKAGLTGLQLGSTIIESYPPGYGNPLSIYPSGFHITTASALVVNRTATTIVSCTSPVIHATTTSCTATVSDTSGENLITPTGTITFTNSTSTIGTCILAQMSVGVASCASPNFVVSSTPGTEAVTASFPSDQSHSKSSGQFSITVT